MITRKKDKPILSLMLGHILTRTAIALFLGSGLVACGDETGAEDGMTMATAAEMAVPNIFEVGGEDRITGEPFTFATRVGVRKYRTNGIQIISSGNPGRLEIDIPDGSKLQLGRTYDMNEIFGAVEGNIKVSKTTTGVGAVNAAVTVSHTFRVDDGFVTFETLDWRPGGRIVGIITDGEFQTSFEGLEFDCSFSGRFELNLPETLESPMEMPVDADTEGEDE